jgi:hypothetical protein
LQPQSRLPLGDQAWFLFHSHYGADTRIAEALFGLVLGGALVAELWFAGHVEITETGLLAPSRTSSLATHAHSDGPPPRPVTDFEQHAWKEINSRPALYPVRDWINFWAAHGPDQVRARMVDRGLLDKVRKNTYVPTDAHVAASPSVSQRYLIENGFHEYRDGDDVRQYYETALLAGLSLATNFDLEVSKDSTLAPDAFRARLQFMVTNLQPQVQFILGEVGRACAGQGRRTGRR